MWMWTKMVEKIWWACISYNKRRKELEKFEKWEYLESMIFTAYSNPDCEFVKIYNQKFINCLTDVRIKK